jgi:hypothetical protein
MPLDPWPPTPPDPLPPTWWREQVAKRLRDAQAERRKKKEAPR